uniref:Reverse transcriptase Ty1/copia-type domain-containing protein n=1 Tax=Cajanus cajan TaxID=3821 RepID=A0A151U5W0_CAJCA|nr:hypothetical protein KK1_007334 [Cajanus cajan]
MLPNLKLTSNDGYLHSNPGAFPKLIGRLLYLTNTRPDLTFAINKYSQYVSTPIQLHYEVSSY